MSGGIYDEGVNSEMGWGVIENSLLVGGVLLNNGHGANAIRGSESEGISFH